MSRTEDRRSVCPACGSPRHRKAGSDEAEGPGRFQVLAARRCSDCGHVWEPQTPRWVLVLGFMTGTVWSGGLIVLTMAEHLVNGQPVRWGWIGLSGMGLIVIAGCWRRWDRRAAESPSHHSDTGLHT